MLEKAKAIYSYISELELLGIADNQIFYSDVAELNLFLIPETLYDEHKNKITNIISRSFNDFYDKENELPLLDIVSISNEDIESRYYELAKDTIFRELKIMQSNKDFLDIFNSTVDKHLINQQSYIKSSCQYNENFQNIYSSVFNKIVIDEFEHILESNLANYCDTKQHIFNFILDKDEFVKTSTDDSFFENSSTQIRQDEVEYDFAA